MILQRTDTGMARSMREVKLMDNKSTKDRIQMLDLNETLISWQKLIVSIGMDMY